MKTRKTIAAAVGLLLSLTVGAQTAGRSFYIDYGQYNVANQGYVTETDANGHVWNNIHGKGTAAPDKAYPQTISLVSGDGTASEYQLQLSTRFSTNGYSNGGLQSPSADLLGDLAIETATEDYIFLEASQDYAIIRFKGLDLNKAYRFYSFGSRTDTSTREATFVFRGLNTWQGDHKMGGSAIGADSYNGNNNNIQESGLIFPDENGEIEMTIIKKTKGGMVHLNVQKMVEYTGVTRPASKYTLTRKAYFDFGEYGKPTSRGDVTSSPDDNGNYWNNMSPGNSTTIVSAGTTVSVVTSDNQSTDIKLVNLQKVAANGYNNGGLKAPTADNLRDMAVAGATQDYMYTENNTVGKMQFQGLDKTKKYRFHIFGTRTDASNYRSTVLTLQGRTGWQTVQYTSGPGLGGDGVNQNVRNISVSDYLSPDEDGNITFTYKQNTAPSCSFGHISVMKLEEFSEEDPGDQTFYVDFGENNVSARGNLTSGADANGNYWTNVYSSSEAIFPQAFPLVNNKNVESDYNLTIGTYFHTNGMSGGGGLTAPSASLLGDLAVATATQDYIHVETWQDYNIIHFNNLNPNKAYRFSLFGSRVVANDRQGSFELRGENAWRGDMQMSGSAIGANNYNGNNNKVLVSDPIFPEKDGHISLTLIKKYKDGMMYLNCMKIEELSGEERPNQELSLKQQMYIDFGETDNTSRGRQTTVADGFGHNWNNVSSGSSSSNVISAGSTVSLVNSDKTSTGATLTVVSKFLTNGISAGGNNAPTVDCLGDLAVQTATEDYAFTEDDDIHYIKLSGLNKNSCYRFRLYGSRATSLTGNNRSAIFTLSGQQEWSMGQFTSGHGIGGQDYHGNIRNVTVSDLIFPDADGEILLGVQRNQSPKSNFAHLNAIKIEEFEGGTRAEDPVVFTNLQLAGNAEDATLTNVPNSKYEFQTYVKLTAGTFTLSGTDKNGTSYTLGSTDTDAYTYESAEAFKVTSDCVARVTVNSKDKTVTVLPVTLNIRGNMGTGNPAIAYKGDGVFESQVTLQETSDQQWVNKTMYFALNNSDDLAVKRLQNASTRYCLGMGSQGQNVENIYQNSGTYTITVDMRNMVYSIDAPVDEYRVSVFGSSVANGQGATDYKGYRYLYGQELISRYKNKRSENPFYTTNVSIGGNTTNSLLGRWDDLTRDFGRYVIFGLSLGNEGIHGASNQEAIFEQWRDNMLKLISMARAEGKVPMVMNNYTRSDYDDSDYSYVKKLNLLIHEWDVPSTNVLGSIDDGTGKWAEGYISDTYHQNTAGHQEFCYAMVPSLYDALKAGKAQPVRNQEKSMVLPAGKKIYFVPEETLHPYTISLRVKKGEGQLAAFKVSGTTKNATLVMNADGTVTFTSPTGASITSTDAITDDEWHTISLTHYYARKAIMLYVDKTCAGTLAENMEDTNLVSLGGDTHAHNLSEVFFWRSGMTPEEIAAVCDGRMLKSSLEIYAPLGGSDDMENLAQSTNTLKYTTAVVSTSVQIPAARYATYVTPFDVDFSQTSNLKAYQVTQVGGSYAHLDEVSHVAAGTAVVLNAEEGTYTIHSLTSGTADDTEDNLLLPALEAVTPTIEGTYYVLAQPEGEEVGFYPVATNTTIAAGKGYLLVTANPAKAYYFDNDQTGITTIAADKASVTGAVYNLAGQQVSAKGLKGTAKKGVYVTRHRKVLK